MEPETLLPLMKIDLGLSSTAFDSRLLDKLSAAIEEIQAEGVTLTDSKRDQDLVLMYAEWRWRERISGEAMPRMLRYALNNRVFGEAAREEAGGEA